MKIVHYINQYFGGIGGEEKADEPLHFVENAVGPARGMQQLLGEKFSFVTAVCGDNYFNSNPEAVAEAVAAKCREEKAVLFVAGPAFNAGRYGQACGAVCAAVDEKLGIPAISGMYEGNPVLETYRRNAYIFPTTEMAAGMNDALKKMAAFAVKLVAEEPLGTAAEEGYFPRGVRREVVRRENGAKRAVDMLMAKLNGQPFATEIPIFVLEKVPPAQLKKPLSEARVAIVTVGGLVPRGNPDKIRSFGAEKWGAYAFDEKAPTLEGKDYETIHGGYNPNFVNANPNYVVPVNILREYESRGTIGSLHPVFYSTAGVGGAVVVCRKTGAEIAGALQEANVDAVILTAT
jgi:glycine reductase